jgi:hypothetical protein
VTLIDLADVYMTVFLRAADAGKLARGDEARIILDEAPNYVVPATVGFVAAPKAAEAKQDLAKLMLRVDLKVDPKVVETYYGKVEIGLRGAGFVRTMPQAKWPADLQVKLPPAPVAQEPAPAPAPVAQQGARASAAIGGASAPTAPAAAPMSAAAPAPVAEASKSEPATQAPAPASAPASAPVTKAAAPVPPPPASTPAPSSQPMSAPAPAPLPAPLAEALRSSPVAREAKLAPPSPPFPAPPFAPGPAHAPAAQASTSEGLGPEPDAGVAPESLAQLAGAWTRSAADCNKLFQRRGSAVAYRQPVDQFAQAAIIESQRIRLPTSICRLERASHEGGALKVSGECRDSISYTSQTAYVKLRSKNEIVFNPNGDPALDTSMKCARSNGHNGDCFGRLYPNPCRSSGCLSFSRCSPCSWCPARRSDWGDAFL